MCIYWKYDEETVVLFIYVDELLFTNTDTAAIDRFCDGLVSISIKHIGCLSKFLIIRVAFDDNGVMLEIINFLCEDGLTTRADWCRLIWSAADQTCAA